MNKYLITGVSGTGKTTIAKELQVRGYSAYDMDSVPGLGAWIERTTGKPRAKDFSSAADWVDRYDWLWNKTRLQNLLKTGTQPIFLCGSSVNQENFYNLFTKIVLLKIDDKTLTTRLLHGNRDHEFGRRPGEIEVILAWYKDFQIRTKAYGASVIDATKPLNKVIDKILVKTNDY
jgi:adenylate kinase family enzyme